MNNNPLISVIVPIYNVEQYLVECLDSLHKQEYQNLEILLIDDGSTDGSAKICEKYVKKDNRFHYYYKENSGQSGARNYALRIFNGDYVSFVDSDDKIASDTYKILASILATVVLPVPGLPKKTICKLTSFIFTSPFVFFFKEIKSINS